MLDALLLLWGLLHTLEDPVVIVACAAIGGTCGAFTRRLDGATWSNGFWPVVGNAAIGGILTGITSAAAAFMGMELFPNYPKLVVGAILFASGIVDTTTDSGRNWVQREIFGRLFAMFDSWKGGRYVPPTSPVGPANVPAAGPIQSPGVHVPPTQPPSAPIGLPPKPTAQVSPENCETSTVGTTNPPATPKKKGPW